MKYNKLLGKKRLMVKVEVLSGRRNIGGNFIRVEDKTRVIVFDQGIRFDLMGAFYAGSIAPRGLRELREMGVVPKAEWYDGVSDIYISHMHLDHLGLLSNIPAKMRVHLPSLRIYEVLEEKWAGSPSWLSIVPRKHYVDLKELRSLEADENGIMPLPVSHSAFPAYSFLYFGSDETILYTGDFRVNGFLSGGRFAKAYGGISMLEYVSENRDIRINRLIIEGTNLGSARPPITPAEEEAMLKRILGAHSLTVATVHPLDLEYALFLASLAAEMGRPLYLASKDIATLMDGIVELPEEPTLIEDYVQALTRFKSAGLMDVEENALVIASYNEIVDLLRDLAAEENLPEGSASILSEPEPRIEEAQEYDVIMNWFSRLGVQAYLMRVSGHYYPHQLKEIIGTIKPKNIELIHTSPHVRLPARSYLGTI